MSRLSEIVIGDWFKLPTGEIFEVVAVDESEGTIEIQHFDGSVEEFDYQAWGQMEISKVAAPEDYSGSLDVTKEDYGMDLDEHVGMNHGNPLDLVEPGASVSEAYY